MMHSNGLDPVLSSVSLTVAPTLSAADLRDATKMSLGTPQELLKTMWKIGKFGNKQKAVVRQFHYMGHQICILMDAT